MDPNQDQDKYSGYDIIGDIHGCGQTLEKLLEVMGYKKISGVYQHPSRQVIFVGDILDRGPHIRKSMNIVYDMVTRGHAQIVMGNHEYNVYCYATIDIKKSQATGKEHFLREHNAHNQRLVSETFEQFANHPKESKEYLKWISTMPLFLDLPNFRVVHACWDHNYINAYLDKYKSNCVSPEIIAKSTDLSSFEGKVLDRLMRGTSLRLPNSEAISSRDGYKRRYFRTKFWADKPQTYSDVVFQPDPLPQHLLDRPLSDEERNRLIHYPVYDKPVFFGHYWLHGKPAPVKSNICCLDYSAVKFGRLVAYRMDGEQRLDPDHYVWLYVDPPEHSGD